jgi:hypothetical protein
MLLGCLGVGKEWTRLEHNCCESCVGDYYAYAGMSLRPDLSCAAIDCCSFLSGPLSSLGHRLSGQGEDTVYWKVGD